MGERAVSNISIAGPTVRKVIKRANGKQAFTSAEAQMSNSQTTLQVKIYKDRSLKSYQIKSEPKKYKKKESVKRQRTHVATLSLRRESGDWVAL